MDPEGNEAYDSLMQMFCSPDTHFWECVEEILVAYTGNEMVNQMGINAHYYVLFLILDLAVFQLSNTVGGAMSIYPKKNSS